jgi:hypothetical protein
MNVTKGEKRQQFKLRKETTIEFNKSILKTNQGADELDLKNRPY